ncbi:MAG: alpha-galactosidase [Armatimonadetes bacterium]|nr:alpha-galactosidase [Armatimonadota bacterium]
MLKRYKLAHSSTRLDGERVRHALVYTDPETRLVTRCLVTEYRDFPAVEWVLYFKNTGTGDTPILENVQALSAEFWGGAAPGDFRLYYADGSKAVITDFQPREAVISGNLSLASFGGRSSDGTLPFFNMVKPDGSGIVFGVGWTGQWAASFNKNTSQTVKVQAGMEITRLKLHPGEEIRTPAILMLFWFGGDRMKGQNQFRKLLLDHYTPRHAGQLIDPPVAASDTIKFETITASNQIQAINAIGSHNLPVAYYWIDTGWYTCGDNWARYVGNWDPDPVRFPNGLKPVADAAHSKGYKFSLWFEPERVMPGTWLYNNHPDWLISPPSNLPPELMYMYYDRFHLLDLSNPAALAWAKSKFSGMIGDVGINMYRNDFNMYPVYYWRKGEPSDRQGMKEIQYIMALYDYFDTLQRDHPNLIIDNCASGGRRIDFEMLRRSVVMTRSDYLWDPTGQQCHTYGLAQWIPLTGIGSDYPETYKVRSGFGSHFILDAQWATLTDTSTWNLAVSSINQLNSVRHLFRGDFYPLSTYSTANNVWMAWQFHRSDIEEGILQAFRRPDSATSSMVYTFKGLDPAATYELYYPDLGGWTYTRTGSYLMQSGVAVTISSKPGAAYITYRKLP